MLNVDTRRKIDSCRDILVGKLPDPKAQIEQITYALIYKFMADMDTASVALGGKASFFVNSYEQYTWDKLMSTNLGGKQRLDLYSEAIAKLSLNPHLPPLFRDIFKDAFLPYRDPETLNMFLKEISWFTYNHSEDLGDAFEYLLSVMSSQGDAGQFRTPRHIIDFIVAVVNPKKDETILDPACGTAGFLISSYKHIIQQNTVEKPGDKLNTDEKQDLMNQIVGYDISPDMVRLSLVNMYLHGFPEPHIYEYDTLTDEGRWEDNFDVIMANPPFMSPKGGIRPHKHFSIQANRSEVLFVDYIAEHLNPDGRAGVIVPEGIIFQSGNAYKSLRKMLVDNYLFCAVSLPAGVFNPYSGVKTSILFLDKTLAKQTDKILFVKIQNDGFDLGAQRREISGSDFPRAFNNVKTYLQSVRNNKEFYLPDSPDILFVTKQQLAENGDYNLSMERYKTEIIHKTQFEIVKIHDISEIITKGTTPTTFGASFKESGVNFIKIEAITEDGHFIKSKFAHIDDECNEALNRSKLQQDDVLFSIAGAFGRAAVVTQDVLPANTNQALSIIRLKKDLALPYFIFNILKSDAIFTEIEKEKTGVAQYNLSLKQIGELEIPLPPLDIQQEIVLEIESYQKIIDGARQVVENYKPQIKIDPEWPSVEMKNIASINNNSVNPKELFGDEAFVYVDIASVENGTGKIHYDQLVNPSDAPSRARRVICNGDILLSTVRPNLQAFAYVAGLPTNCLASTGFAVLSVNKNINSKYVYYSLYNDYVMKQMTDRMGKGSYPSINQNDVEFIKIALPEREIQDEIASSIEKEQQLVDANKQLIQIYEQKIKERIAEVWET
jgi:type I restriction enzyme M protein